MPAEKAGLATMVTDLLDEGAGDLDARAFHEKVENYAISIGFSATRDNVYRLAADLVRTSGCCVRSSEDWRSRRRASMPMSLNASAARKYRGLRRAAMSPNELASRRWWETAFPGHPYSIPVNGTLESLPGITVDDMKGYVARIFAKNTLKIGIVGNVDAATAGKIVDRIFGSLPAKANLVGVPEMAPKVGDGKVSVEIDVPQSVVMVGGAGIARHDPDFIPAYVLNHILGGGSFSSRLYREVREVRGLAYSVYSALMPLDRTALFIAGTATRSDRAEQSLDVIVEEIQRMAKDGPTAAELADAKSYPHGLVCAALRYVEQDREPACAVAGRRSRHRLYRQAQRADRSRDA